MRPTESTEGSLYSIMRNMDMNTKLVVPYEQWAMVRSMAHGLKKDFGAKFKVRRMMTPRTKLNFILVKRIE